ncbi:unnamed protein product, partial [Ectocarpus fasciculatus]
ADDGATDCHKNERRVEYVRTGCGGTEQERGGLVTKKRQRNEKGMLCFYLCLDRYICLQECCYGVTFGITRGMKRFSNHAYCDFMAEDATEKQHARMSPQQ